MKLGPEGRKRAIDLESLDVETLAWKLAEAEEIMRIQQQHIEELETALDLSLRVMTSSREVLLAHGGGEMPTMNAVIEMAKCALAKVSNG